MKQQVDLDELREYVAETYNRAIRNAELERIAQGKVLNWIADQIVSNIQVSESEQIISEPVRDVPHDPLRYASFPERYFRKEAKP